MNWLAYNYAHDLELPNSTRQGRALPHVPAGRDRRRAQDSLDPTTFSYTITSRELT